MSERRRVPLQEALKIAQQTYEDILKREDAARTAEADYWKGLDVEDNEQAQISALAQAREIERIKDVLARTITIVTVKGRAAAQLERKFGSMEWRYEGVPLAKIQTSIGLVIHGWLFEWGKIAKGVKPHIIDNTRSEVYREMYKIVKGYEVKEPDPEERLFISDDIIDLRFVLPDDARRSVYPDYIWDTFKINDYLAARYPSELLMRLRYAPPGASEPNYHTVIA